MGTPAHTSTCCGCTLAGCDVSCNPCGIPTCAELYFDHYKDDCTLTTYNVTLTRPTNGCVALGQRVISDFNLGLPPFALQRFTLHQFALYCVGGATVLQYYTVLRDPIYPNVNVREIFVRWNVLATSCSPLDMYADAITSKTLSVAGTYYSTSVLEPSNINQLTQFCSGYGSGGGCGKQSDALDNLCNTFNVSNVSIVAC